METIFMNSENSRTTEYHVLTLKLTDKLNLRRGQKTVALSNLGIYYMWKNIKSSYNDNKFKISAPTWSEEFELPDESYSISDIQDYCEYLKMFFWEYSLIINKHNQKLINMFKTQMLKLYLNIYNTMK